MMRIKVNPDQLRQAARQCRLASSELQGLGNHVGSIVGGLQMEVRVRTNMDSQVATARHRAQRLANEAELLARFLEERANAFQQADEQSLISPVMQSALAALFGTLGGRFLIPTLKGALSALGGLLASPPEAGTTQLPPKPISNDSVEDVSEETYQDDYVSQYDGTRPAAKMDSSHGKPGQVPLEAPITSDTTNRSPNRYQDVINQFAVGNNKRYESDDYTYCNTFAGDVARAMGVSLPQKKEFGRPGDRATIGFPQLYQYFTDPKAPVKAADEGWRELSTNDLGTLESHVNVGRMAVVVTEGHIAVVRPGQEISSFEEIKIAQAGAQCGNEMTLAQGFGNVSSSAKIFIID